MTLAQGTRPPAVPLNLPENRLILAGIGWSDGLMTRRILIIAGLFVGGWALGWMLTDNVLIGLLFALIFSGAGEGVQAAASHDD